MAATTCPYCDGEILVGARKCKHCGEWQRKGHHGSLLTRTLLAGIYFCFAIPVYLIGEAFWTATLTTWPIDGAYAAGQAAAASVWQASVERAIPSPFLWIGVALVFIRGWAIRKERAQSAQKPWRES